MKRFVNVRLPVLIACVLALGVAAGYLFNFYTADIFWVIIVVPVTAVVFIVLLIFKKIKPLVFSVILIAVFTGGLLNSYYRLENYSSHSLNSGETYLITGTVDEKGANSAGEFLILSGATANGKRVDGKIYVRLSEAYGDYADVGYTVNFSSVLTSNDTFPYGKLNRYAQNNIKYTCSVYGGLQAEYRFSLFGSIRSAFRNLLYENLDRDTASICYAMLIGDTQNVDDNALSSFRYGGIAHIFAVSGLHIGIIFLIVGFILKLFKPNKYASAIIRVAVIFFYAGVCGFSLSSLRAVIMCTISIISGLVYCKNDTLNSLSCAVFIILLCTPLSLFSVGFQLSVCAVGGFAVISKRITKLLQKIKIPNKIASSAGTAFGAQFGTFPVMLSSFGYVSGSGLILNVFLIPVISVLFTILFVTVLISLIVPVIAPFVLSLAALPLEALLSFLLSSGFENSLISGFGAGLFIPIYYFAFFILSDKINLKFIPRATIFSVVTSLLIGYVLIMNYTPVSGCKVAVSANYYGGNVIIKSSQGTVLVTTGSSNTSNFLNENYSSHLDAVVIIGGEECISNYDTSLNCNDLYIYNMYFPAQPYRNVTVHYEQNFTLCGVNFEFADGYSLVADCDGVKIGICAGENIPIENCDLLISKYENTNCKSDCTVYFSLKDHKYNIYDFGDMHFKIKNGGLFISGLTPYRPCYY